MPNSSFRVAVVHRGVYDPSEAYVPLDEIQYNGSTYRNRQACQGISPTNITNWILVAQKGLDLMAPTGVIIAYPSAIAPDGYLNCHGAAVSRTSYANLFAVIGTMFGTGNGSTTFDLPDFRGEFLRGWDAGKGTDPSRSLGSYQAGTKITGERDAPVGDGNARGHGIADVSNVYSDPAYGENGFNTDILVSNNYTGDPALDNWYTHNDPLLEYWRTTRPRNIAVNFIIKY